MPKCWGCSTWHVCKFFPPKYCVLCEILKLDVFLFCDVIWTAFLILPYWFYGGQFTVDDFCLLLPWLLLRASRLWLIPIDISRAGTKLGYLISSLMLRWDSPFNETRPWLLGRGWVASQRIFHGPPKIFLLKKRRPNRRQCPTLNEPSVLMHWASCEQPPLLIRHSLTSMQVMPLPLKPSLHVHS